MLYNPKWEKKTETTADPFLLESLIAWLEMRPATEIYNYFCNGHCLLAQYFTAHGYKNVSMGAGAFVHMEARKRAVTKIPDIFNLIAQGYDQSTEHCQHFGAALKRARAAQFELKINCTTACSAIAPKSKTGNCGTS